MCLAVPGKVLSIDRQNDLLPMAKVSFGGIDQRGLPGLCA